MNLDQAVRNFKQGTSLGWIRAQSTTMGTPQGAGPLRSTLRMTGKDGKPAYLPELLVKYKKDCKAGWKCPKGALHAVSPPGWSKTVEEMKQHPEIDNPWALAWYLKEQGAVPGGSKGKK